MCYSIRETFKDQLIGADSGQKCRFDIFKIQS